MLRRINPDRVQPLGDNYSQIVAATGKQYHISGTLPVDEDGTPTEGDMRQQTEAVVKNLQRSLDAVGADVSDVARVRIFTLDADEYMENCHSVLLDWYDGDKPASTMCEVARLASEQFLVEVDATAFVDE